LGLKSLRELLYLSARAAGKKSFRKGRGATGKLLKRDSLYIIYYII